MQLGIFSRTYASRDLEETCQRMKAHALSWTQFNLLNAGLASLPHEVSDEKLQWISSTFHRYNIRPAALSGTFNMIDPYETARKKACAQFSVQCRIASELGIPIVTLCTGSRHPQNQWIWHGENLSQSAWTALMRSTEAVLKHAENYRVRLGIEPEINNIICSPEKARAYLDAVGSQRMGIIMDGANLFRTGQTASMEKTLTHAFEVLGDDIILAHAKDFICNGSMEFVAPGEGVLDYGLYIRLLKRYGYRGALIMHGLSEQQVPQSQAFLRQILEKQESMPIS